MINNALLRTIGDMYIKLNSLRSKPSLDVKKARTSFIRQERVNCATSGCRDTLNVPTNFTLRVFARRVLKSFLIGFHFQFRKRLIFCLRFPAS